MKLLFDQNISFRILKKISETYSGSSHVKIEGLKNASDLEIWEYAKLHQFIIVTQDSDFNDIFFLKGFPPKILWFRTGNLPTDELSFILQNQQSDILDFGNNDELGCLEFSKAEKRLP
jgi:predicted nuclease of predicted toxin-antitoxin system